jgi:hypothetical protein
MNNANLAILQSARVAELKQAAALVAPRQAQRQFEGALTCPTISAVLMLSS